jgi:hypothetical protein
MYNILTWGWRRRSSVTSAVYDNALSKASLMASIDHFIWLLVIFHLFYWPPVHDRMTLSFHPSVPCPLLTEILPPIKYSVVHFPRNAFSFHLSNMIQSIS